MAWKTVIVAAGIDAITLCNTTTARPESLASPHAKERGGLSGTPLFEMSNAMLREVYDQTGGTVPLIDSIPNSESGGVAGVMSVIVTWPTPAFTPEALSWSVPAL